jgi:hypothetical protein
MLSVITNIYNRKTKGPTLMELIPHTRQHSWRDVDACVWQELEYRIDVCRVTRDVLIEHL